MKRAKRLYILLGVLAVLSVAAIAVIQREEHKEKIKDSGETILQIPYEGVTALSWENESESLSFHKGEDGVWTYDEDEKFPVSEEKIKELLEPFEEFAAAFVIEEVEDYSQYGLNDPVCTIHLENGEQELEIKLGNFSNMDSQRYVSIGDGKAYLVKAFGAGLLLGLGLLLFGRPFLSLFTTDPQVMDAGMYRLTVMSVSYCVSAFMDGSIAASRGLGKSAVPMVIVILGSCVFRIIWVYTVFAWFGTITSLYLLYVFSWTITAAAEIIYFIRIYRQATADLAAA